MPVAWALDPNPALMSVQKLELTLVHSWRRMLYSPAYVPSPNQAGDLSCCRQVKPFVTNTWSSILMSMQYRQEEETSC
jgi:hypothetical protein